MKIMKVSNILHTLSLIAWVCTALVSLCSSNASGAEHTVRSPDGKVAVRLVCEDSRLSYSLVWNERELFQNSALSLVPVPNTP